MRLPDLGHRHVRFCQTIPPTTLARLGNAELNRLNEGVRAAMLEYISTHIRSLVELVEEPETDWEGMKRFSAELFILDRATLEQLVQGEIDQRCNMRY